MITLRDLTRDELPRARALLESCDLPTGDLDDPTIALVGAFDGAAMIGVVGLQACGDVGLLRSLAVEPAHRDRGVARKLCDRVVAMARGPLWLLTTSAEGYFTRAGFVTVPRTEAPPAIAASAQFASLCPSTARLMRRA